MERKYGRKEKPTSVQEKYICPIIRKKPKDKMPWKSLLMHYKKEKLPKINS